jgi:hypothetical protein
MPCPSQSSWLSVIHSMKIFTHCREASSCILCLKSG